MELKVATLLVPEIINERKKVYTFALNERDGVKSVYGVNTFCLSEPSYSIQSGSFWWCRYRDFRRFWSDLLNRRLFQFYNQRVNYVLRYKISGNKVDLWRRFQNNYIYYFLNHKGHLYFTVTAALPMTPIMQTRRMKMASCDDVITTASPSTPHRIELRNDQQEENLCKKQLIVQIPQPPPKGRRKLNNSQAINTTHNDKNTNHKVTEYFPVRRSVRKTKTTVLEEKQLALERAVRNKVEEGLEVMYFDGKGRGVVAAKDFKKGDFVVEYSGDLIDIVQAKLREDKYAQNENAGCYMYYFKHNEQQYCIDATAESGRLGRLVNHSRNGNLLTRTIMVDKKPRLILLAKEDIKTGEEVLYDYGDRSKESLQHHPWLAF